MQVWESVSGATCAKDLCRAYLEGLKMKHRILVVWNNRQIERHLSNAQGCPTRAWRSQGMFAIDLFGIMSPSQQASILNAPPDEADEVSSAFRPKRVQKRPWDWPGWTYIERTRKSGKQAGTKYREYFDPNGKKYRSKKDAVEVAKGNN